MPAPTDSKARYICLSMDSVTKNELKRLSTYLEGILTIIPEIYERLWWLCRGGRAAGAMRRCAPQICRALCSLCGVRRRRLSLYLYPAFDTDNGV
jgi:tRNA A37 threonylcarbamoyladenosine synthetase subunit TsaC/SUA5/YrdC